MTTYQIVQYDPDLGWDTANLTIDNLVAWCEIRGYDLRSPNNNPANRAELQGQPRFGGLCGPMWGGNGIIRYETAAAYAQLSQ